MKTTREEFEIPLFDRMEDSVPDDVKQQLRENGKNSFQEFKEKPLFILPPFLFFYLRKRFGIYMKDYGRHRFNSIIFGDMGCSLEISEDGLSGSYNSVSFYTHAARQKENGRTESDDVIFEGRTFLYLESLISGDRGSCCLTFSKYGLKPENFFNLEDLQHNKEFKIMAEVANIISLFDNHKDYNVPSPKTGGDVQS